MILRLSGREAAVNEKRQEQDPSTGSEWCSELRRGDHGQPDADEIFIQLKANVFVPSVRRTRSDLAQALLTRSLGAAADERLGGPSTRRNRQFS